MRRRIESMIAPRFMMLRCRRSRRRSRKRYLRRMSSGYSCSPNTGKGSSPASPSTSIALMKTSTAPVGDALGEAIMVAQVDEQQAAMVADAVAPAGKPHIVADVARAKRAAGVGAITMHGRTFRGRQIRPLPLACGKVHGPPALSRIGPSRQRAPRSAQSAPEGVPQGPESPAHNAQIPVAQSQTAQGQTAQVSIAQVARAQVATA